MEEEDEEEGAEEGGGFNWKRFLLFCIPITFIVLFLLALAIILTILLLPRSASSTSNHSVIIIEQEARALNETEERRNKTKKSNQTISKPDFNIEFVELKLNFTDAEVFCNSKNGTLAVLFDEPEEEYFLEAIRDNSDFLTDCHNQGFIGYRMILEEELKVDGIPMLTFTGELTGFANMWLENHYDASKECAILIYHPDSSEFGMKSEPCTFQASCYLCETTQGCPRDYPFCYIWRHKINHSETYSTANTYCMEKKNGHLARIRNKHMMDAMLRQLQTSAGKLFWLYSTQACTEGYYISKQQMDLGPLGFESIDEHQINYMSYNINLERQPFGAHCLGVVQNSKKEISFVPVRCDKESCFVCRSESHADTKT